MKAAPFPYCLKQDLQDLWDFQDWGTCDESHYYEQEIAPTGEVNGEPTECAYEVVCHGCTG